jgi:hypothetical protein
MVQDPCCMLLLVQARSMRHARQLCCGACVKGRCAVGIASRHMSVDTVRVGLLHGQLWLNLLGTGCMLSPLSDWLLHSRAGGMHWFPGRAAARSEYYVTSSSGGRTS